MKLCKEVDINSDESFVKQARYVLISPKRAKRNAGYKVYPFKGVVKC